MIKREKDNSKKYYYQNKKREDLIREYRKQTKNLDELIGQPHFIFCFDKKDKNIKNTSLNLVNKRGYKITRYFMDKKNNKVYLAFECSS